MKNRESITWNQSGENSDRWGDIQKFIIEALIENNLELAKFFLRRLAVEISPKIKIDNEHILTTIKGINSIDKFDYFYMDLLKEMDEVGIYHYSVKKEESLPAVMNR